MDPIAIFRYFPEFDASQRASYIAFGEAFREWNSRLNLISRKDMDAFYERHVLHSLAIARVIRFEPGSRILDIGTGGGFPGIPLAIAFPHCHFVLMDSIAKKIAAVESIVSALHLSNTTALCGRAENHREKYDFIVSRAVTAMPDFLPWTKEKFLPNNRNKLANGILYLKGGDLSDELESIGRPYAIYSISDYFKEEFFATKKVVYIPMN
jgi:16S rRNA (guanine527-N7)-methyltransferase